MIEKLRDIKFIVIDVDGTMTDAGIYYDMNGNETKKFCTKDAAGFFTAHAVGMQIMVLTGRESYPVIRRMEEMKVEYIVQNIHDKYSYLKEFMDEHTLTQRQVAYIGDDLNDLAPMSLAGFVGCPKDSCEEILLRADYVSAVKGGYGAVRDIISYMLIERGEWKEAVKRSYPMDMITL